MKDDSPTEEELTPTKIVPLFLTGPAAYAAPGEGPLYETACFLRALRTVEPRVLITLRDNVFRRGSSENDLWRWANGWHLIRWKMPNTIFWGTVRETLTAWEKWSFLDDEVLRWGSEYRFKVKEGEWPSVEGRRMIPIELTPPPDHPLMEVEAVPFRFECRGFNPRAERPGDYREAVTADFEEDLARHIEEQMQACDAAEMEANTTRREQKHFEMLVRWQCQRWTWRRIADEYGYGERRTDRLNKRHTGISGAKKAVAETAELIGLKLRRGKQGRYRKPDL